MPDTIDFLMDSEDYEKRAGGPALEVVRNRLKARKRARWGIGSAVGGFGLQIVAQIVNVASQA